MLCRSFTPSGMARFTLSFRLIALTRPKTLGLSAIRPGYPSAIVCQSNASPRFCQVNFTGIPGLILAVNDDCPVRETNLPLPDRMMSPSDSMPRP
jgi:hypothetical protein